MEKNYLLHWRVETDEELKGEYATIERALSNAKPEDHVIEVTYREISTKVIKVPEPRVNSEVKRSDWLVLGGEKVKRFCIDADPLDLSEEEKKDPFAHRIKIYARIDEYMPFTDVDDIKTVTLQRKKFGARIVGDPANTTDWGIFNSYKECVSFLEKTHNIKIKTI